MAPVPRVLFNVWIGRGYPLLLKCVVVGAVKLATASFIEVSAALTGLIVAWVVLHFLPPVTLAAPILQFAAIFIGLSILLGGPGFTLGLPILIEVRLASKVLPVMRVKTLVSLVILVAEGTPHGLEVKQVKVDVALHFLEDVDREF